VTRPLRIAHRGDWRHVPENSLAAMLAALAVPACDGLEFDVRAAADGTPVLLHDRTLTRVQGRRVAVDALPAAELAALGVPSLAEVLAAVPEAAFLDVELKVDLGPAAADLLEARRGPALRNAVISSFEPGTLAGAADARPGWPRWLNAEDLSEATIRTAVELGCAAVSAPVRAINGRSVARARRAGLEVAAWTARDAATFERVAALGVIAVCVEAAALDG
jgi:glycerophosphoryl diester phosphodiesterase